MRDRAARIKVEGATAAIPALSCAGDHAEERGLPRAVGPSTPILAPGENESEVPLRIWRFGGTVLPTCGLRLLTFDVNNEIR